jgi:hypothetical protein
MNGKRGIVMRIRIGLRLLMVVPLAAVAVIACGNANDKGDIIPVEPTNPAQLGSVSTSTTLDGPADAGTVSTTSSTTSTTVL